MLRLELLVPLIERHPNISRRFKRSFAGSAAVALLFVFHLLHYRAEGGIVYVKIITARGGDWILFRFVLWIENYLIVSDRHFWLAGFVVHAVELKEREIITHIDSTNPVVQLGRGEHPLFVVLPYLEFPGHAGPEQVFKE